MGSEALRILQALRAEPLPLPAAPPPPPPPSIADAKARLAPEQAPAAWLRASSAPRSFAVRSLPGGDVIAAFIGDGGREVCFADNTPRVDFSEGAFAPSGDDLPHVPVVLRGVAAGWAAMRGAGWSLAALAARCGAGDCFSLDGGPGFARASLSSAAVDMKTFAAYAAAGGAAERDAAPLYIFDEGLRTRRFADGSPMAAEFALPRCFTADTMAASGAAGELARPLPPSWLLVGPPGSGTPIHNHPLTVGWNTLLCGAKLWVILPPCTDAALLLVGAANTLTDDEDLSALAWLEHCAGALPPAARVIVQAQGETVFLPAGWWHVVLNLQSATALSHSLYLRRDWELLGRSGGACDEGGAAFESVWRRGVEAAEAAAEK